MKTKFNAAVLTGIFFLLTAGAAKASCTLVIDSITVTNVVCRNPNAGSLCVHVSGGTAPFSYNWSNGAITSCILNIPAGPYVVTVTDANNCSATGFATVNQPVPPAVSMTVTNVLCNGESTGKVIATITGGGALDEFVWNNGDSTNTNVNLATGTYYITVTDTAGCATIDSAVVTGPSAIIINATIDNATCGFNNGSIDLAVAGGTPNYTYAWSGGAGTNAHPINLAPGSYSVTITDNNGCSATANHTINNSPLLTLNPTITPVTCFGVSAGKIVVTPNGTPPYTFSSGWTSLGTSAYQQNLAAGSYSVAVTDAHGCTGSGTYMVTQPTELVVTSLPTNSTCGFGGTITVTVSGGTPPYQYLWNDGAVTQNRTGLAAGTYAVTVTDQNTCTATLSDVITSSPALTATETHTNATCVIDGSITVTVSGGAAPYTFLWSDGTSTQNRTNVMAGNYSVTITDANTCTAVLVVTITTTDGVSLTSTQVNESCFGQSNGSITTTVSGGTSPYTYSWNDGSSTTPNRTGLAAGTYSVTATDANSCSAFVTVNITQPTEFVIDSFTVTNVSCYGASNGSICVHVSGGTPPYVYTWSNSSNSQCLTSLSPNIYEVTVQDANGCNTVEQDTVNQPLPLTVSATGTNTGCSHPSDGVITVTGTGGTPPYQYSLSPVVSVQQSNVFTGLAAGNYVAIVIDANGCYDDTAHVSIYDSAGVSLTVTYQHPISCHGDSDDSITVVMQGGTPPYQYSSDGIIFSSSVTFAGMTPGSYTITGRDANGCLAVYQDSVVAPALLVIDTFNVTSVPCNNINGGAICAQVSGGTPGYTFSWSNSLTGQCISGLSLGNYTVTVVDNHFCTATGTATVNQGAPLTINSFLVVPVTCFGLSNGEICAEVSGGTPPYTYNWSPFGTSQCINNLPAGNYWLTVTDVNNCSAGSGDSISQPTAITASAIGTDASCSNAFNGTITVTASGGTPPYTYSLAGPAQMSNVFNGLQGGNSFLATVFDANGCVDTSSALVGNSYAISLNLIYQHSISCNGGSDGIIVVGGTGGVSPYQYSINGIVFQASDTFSGLSLGAYIIEFRDGSGCTAFLPDTITQPAALADSLVVTNSCTTGGSICANVLGGTAPYTYMWSNFTSTSCTNGLSVGEYYLIATDAHGCNIRDSASIASDTTPLTIDSFTVINATCNGSNTGSICVNVSGGTQPYMYVWNNTDTSRCLTSVSAGTYGLTIVDAYSCTAGAWDSIVQSTALTIDSFTITNASCFASSNGTMRVHVSGGTTPYVFSWNPNVSITGDSIDGLSPGIYFVTVTDINGCSAGGWDTITQPAPLTASVVDTNVICFNGTSGSACVFVSGGVGPYTYVWSNALISSCIEFLSAGNYTVTSTDANGCSVSAAVTVTQPTQLTASISVSGCSLCAVATGGTPSYLYVWANGDTTQCITNLYPGNYDLTISDANNCTASTSQMVTSGMQVQVLIADSNAVPDSVSIIINNGVQPYLVQWYQTQVNYDTLTGNTGSYVYNAPGIYHAIVVDSAGCGYLLTIDAGCTDQCVWPGDANYDGIVDNNDLLPIGLGYDSLGYARSNPTINFIPQYCQNWTDTLLGGVNYKHVDCNGDGIITADDTSAIMLNYSLTHPRSGGQAGWKSNAPVLQLTMIPDTLIDGETVSVIMSLGDSLTRANNVYGLAFAFNYDPLVVDSSSVNMTFSNSWLCGTGDHINIAKKFAVSGQVQAALTRIDHTTRSGSGVIGSVAMKITTGNINGKDLQYYLMRTFISNLTVIDNYGNVLPFNEGFDSAQVAFTPTGIVPVTGDLHDLKIYPNPASDQLNIDSRRSTMDEIELLDLTGKMVIQQYTGTVHHLTIDISLLSEGVYIIKVTSGGQEYYSRFVKGR